MNPEMRRQPYRKALNSINGELSGIFVKFGLPKEWPFNGSEEQFLLEDMNGNHWKNQKRLQFVSKYAAQAQTRMKAKE